MDAAEDRATPHEATPPGVLHGPGLFRDLPREHAFEPLRVEGRLPDDLEGTLYRVGPAVFRAGETRRRHWFDGDGAVTAVRFAAGRAHGSVRLVQTDALRSERRAGRAIHGGYGTRARSWLRAMVQTHVTGMPTRANTSVALWQGRLFALYEACRPVEVTPDLLETRGESDLGGAVLGAFSAHPHRVRARQCAYNFGVRYGRETRLELFALPDRGEATRIGSVPIAGPSMVHDFAATERHLVFLVPPLRLDYARALTGRGTYVDNLRWEPGEGTEVVVVPIDDPSAARRFKAEPFFQWHIANAFERADGRIVLDLARYPDFASEKVIQGVYDGTVGVESDSVLGRATIDPVAGRLEWETIWARSCEFATAAPSRGGREHRFVHCLAYASRESACAGLHDRVARADVATGAVSEVSLGDGVLPSEPLFVPRAGSADAEDDGYVLTMAYDSRRDATAVFVLSAGDLAAGPIARAWFDHRIPPTLHGVWSPAA